MNTEKKQLIEKALKYDALLEAEIMTGKSYKTDKETETLGFLSFIAHNQLKEQLLSSEDDTTFHETEKEYMRKVVDFGFKKVLTVPFQNEHNIEERLHIMWHDKYSILLKWDTYTDYDDGSWAKSGETVPPPSRNSGSFYYNWTPNKDYIGGATSSGGYISNGDKNNYYSHMFNSDFTPHLLPKQLRDIQPKWTDSYEIFASQLKLWETKVNTYLTNNSTIRIWSGDHDSREALKFNINKLIENGTFLKKWENQPFIWLLHYMDNKNDGYDHKTITNQRIAMLPQYIQEAIIGEIL